MKHLNSNTEHEGRGRFGERWLKIALLLVLWDIVAVHVAYFLALWLRFDCRFSAISPNYLTQYYHSITLYSAVAVLIFAGFRLYRSVWRYASVDELLRCAFGSMLASVLYTAARWFYFLNMPRSYHVFGLIIQMVLIILPRFSYRFYLSLVSSFHGRGGEQERIMIIGAGSSGQMLLKDMKRAPETNARVVCLIDDDPGKQGRFIEGVQVVGGRDEILAAVEKYRVDKIFLSIPRASAEDKRDILNICKETDCKLMQLPAMSRRSSPMSILIVSLSPNVIDGVLLSSVIVTSRFALLYTTVLMLAFFIELANTAFCVSLMITRTFSTVMAENFAGTSYSTTLCSDAQ